MLQLDPDAASVVRAKYCQAGPGFLAKNTATQGLDNYIGEYKISVNYEKYCHSGPIFDRSSVLHQHQQKLMNLLYEVYHQLIYPTSTYPSPLEIPIRVLYNIFSPFNNEELYKKMPPLGHIIERCRESCW